MDNKCKEITFRVPLLGLAKYGSLNSYDNIYFCRFMIQIVHGWFYMCMCSLSFIFPNGSVFPYLLTDLTCNTKFWGATKSSSLYPSLTAKLKKCSSSCSISLYPHTNCHSCKAWHSMRDDYVIIFTLIWK